MEFVRKNRVAVAAFLVGCIVFFFAGEKRQEAKALSNPPAGIANIAEGAPSNVNFAAFWKAWNLLSEDYVPTGVASSTQTDDQKKVYGAIQGLTASLGDPYTVFFPPSQSKLFASDIAGSFSGVGMEVVEQNGALTVIAPLKDSPAAKAGILAGDQILKIDSTDTANLTTDAAVDLIRGDKGTTVTFTVYRASKKDPFTVKVVRGTIALPVIDEKDLSNGIYEISLYSFSEDSANLFRGALRDFYQSGDQKLILDLRGNPGGYLEAAVDMASWFLPSGDVVVQEDYGAGKDKTVYKSLGYDVFNDNLKFAILVDSGSASASEILAGALSEHGKATLIGEKTFGKGSVQELVNLTPDTTLKVTIARWLTPNGLSISEQGIEPAIKVDLTEADAKLGKDPQLERAIEFLNTGK